MRVGMGYDVHRLVEGRKLILGGVEIEHTKGLLGHSDADALLHAVSEAILGALALGDGLAVLRNALDGVLHDLLRLALDAIRLDSHSYLQMSYGASPHFIGGVRRYQRGH